jgi:hypothetical protein
MICFECNHDHDFEERPWCDLSNYEIEHRNLLQENARLREALLKISVPDPVSYDGMMAYSYKLIAREALKSGE